MALGVFSNPSPDTGRVCVLFTTVLSPLDAPPGTHNATQIPMLAFEFAHPHNITYELSLITNVKPPREISSPPCRGWQGSRLGSPGASSSSVCGHRRLVVMMGISASCLNTWTTRASSGTHSCSASSILFKWATFWVSFIHSCGDETWLHEPKEMLLLSCPLTMHPWDPGSLPLAGRSIPGNRKCWRSCLASLS